MRSLVAFLLVFFLCLPAMASEKFDYASFARIPVQHEGRVKPIDTFARNFLYSYSGRESLNGMSAEAWLAETLFDPAQALQRPVFRILRPELLDLHARDKRYYSYADIAPALQNKADLLQTLSQQKPESLGEDQRELLHLQESVFLYTQLLRSFSYLLPLNISIPPSLAKEWKIEENTPFTVKEFGRFDTRLQSRLAAILKRKGDNLSRYTEEEKSIAQFALEMRVMQQAAQDNILFRIIPGEWGAQGEWFSPWALMQSGQGSPQNAQYLEQWRAIALSYLQQDEDAWKNATAQTLTASGKFYPASRLTLEYYYSSYQPLQMALWFYMAAFLCFILYATGTNGPWRALGLLSLGAGGVLNACAIAARVMILSRPPVGTLYESIIFVAFVCVAVSLALECIKKDGNGWITGALCGLLLLFAAETFAQDDTLKMLVAVLNTNFWLATHVLCITMGYGWCLVVSLLAHIWMIKTATGRKADQLPASIKTLALVSLLFTTVGTILGGIWADQSWGRFWGWDPKENGALLIVLWLIWVVHAQISGHFKRLEAITAFAALSMIVAIAWFGVNLLSVGLHSYGFISGVAGGLAAFIGTETLLIGYLWLRIRRMQKAAS